MLSWRPGSGLRMFGHPVHAMLVHFPMSLLMLSLPCDLIGFWTRFNYWHRMGYWIMVGGLIFAAPAAAAGLADFAALQKDHPGESTAFRHLTVMVSAISLFILSLLVRGGIPFRSPGRTAGALTLAGAGMILLFIGGWLGGELTFRHRIGLRA